MSKDFRVVRGDFTVGDSLPRDTCGVLAIALLVELHSALASRGAVHAEHAQVPHMDA